MVNKVKYAKPNPMSYDGKRLPKNTIDEYGQWEEPKISLSKAIELMEKAHADGWVKQLTTTDSWHNPSWLEFKEKHGL